VYVEATLDPAAEFPGDLEKLVYQWLVQPRHLRSTTDSRFNLHFHRQMTPLTTLGA
jgi:hypothetical protein